MQKVYCINISSPNTLEQTGRKKLQITNKKDTAKGHAAQTEANH
jgi:hypothetical protein